MERAHGRIERLLPVHGVVVTDAGAKIQFHRTCVVDGRFDRLQIGDAVDLVLSGEGATAEARAVFPRTGEQAS